MFIAIQSRSTKFVQLTWKLGQLPPNIMLRSLGAAVVHGSVAYFSQGNRVYTYTIAKFEWSELKQCEHEYFAMAVVNDKVTTIGGYYNTRAINTLFSLSEHKGMFGSGPKWRELLPPMSTARVNPAAITTPTHLIVAGGRTRLSTGTAFCSIEILDINSSQWFSVSGCPQALGCPNMTLIGEDLYLSENETIFSCSLEILLKSSKHASTCVDRSDDGSVWTKLTNIPLLNGSCLTTLKGRLVSMGCNDKLLSGAPRGIVHCVCYNKNTDHWMEVGDMPTPRSDTLVAVLHNNEVLVVGGVNEHGMPETVTEIAIIEKVAV